MKKIIRVVAIEPAKDFKNAPDRDELLEINRRRAKEQEEKDNAVYNAGLNLAHYRKQLVKGMTDGGIQGGDAEYIANQIIVRMAGERI